MKAARSRTMAGISSESGVNGSHSPPFQRRLDLMPVPDAAAVGTDTLVPPVLGRWFFQTAEARARRAAVARQGAVHPVVAAWQAAEGQGGE